MPAEDIYKRDVDFTTLALQYPDFSKRLKSNKQLDFSDPESVRQLTKALLHRDFNLNINLPNDRLCPPVPNRFNYVLFAQRLIDTTNLDYNDGESLSGPTIGFDIGTGASAIYPLLACRLRSTWAFLATEIDTKSRSYAEHNISSNDLQSRIKFLETDLSGQTLIPTDKLQSFDDYAIRIQITNPPFYSSEAEMLQSAKQKARPPNSACTGAPVEMIVDGGEVKFVSRLIKESASSHNRVKIQWFSSMLGKLSSVNEVIEQLKEVGCSNYAVTEFVQGQKTRRWCVAWSWLHVRPPSAVARSITALDKKYLPFPSEFDFEVVDKDAQVVGHLLNTEVSKLDLQWRYSEKSLEGMGRTFIGDVWSRKARRRKLRDEEMRDTEDQSSVTSEQISEPALAFRINLQPLESSAHSTPHSKIRIRWLQGQDTVLFESFCGWLKRKIHN